MDSPISKLIAGKQLILGSKSPRRSELLRQIGLEFQVISKDVEEVWPEDLSVDTIAEYLAVLKANAFTELDSNQIVLCADTTVVVDQVVLNKPTSKEHAVEMLMMLSGRSHQVISGVCAKSQTKVYSTSCTTHVEFKSLTLDEIQFYIDTFIPFDKAGSYGIQEWIGSIAITSIQGSYNNVVGLPTHLIPNVLTNVLS